MAKPMNILLLEDNESDIKLLDYQLRKSGMSFKLHVADTENDFVWSLENHAPDIVLSDHSLPSFNSIMALRIVRNSGTDIPFILVTGTVSEEFAVRCMKEGADDYILKSSLTRLPAAIENCLAKKQIRREKEMVESLHARLKMAYDEIEQMNKDVTDSINYARFIQEAVLPPRQQLSQFFPDSFIFYRPKDIVSGDFYWFSEIEGKLIFVIADCTGHGVPGALMSMIGSNLLNEIVNLRHITKPGEILSELNEGIRKLLNRDTYGNRALDGMDIGICKVNRRTRELHFAGARQNLFFFKERTLTCVKGERIGIGGLQLDAPRVFTNHEISYDEGDSIYMFTDGYTDQFGGEEGKRLQTKNFIHIIEEILPLSMSDQEFSLSLRLINWQGNLKQTDDILVAGIRL